MPRDASYLAFCARYGEQVRVDGSSSAGTCWLRIDTAMSKNDHNGGPRKDADALLTVQQARILIAGLQAFIEDATEES